MWFRSLGREDPLEKEMATPSNKNLPEKFHGQRNLVGNSPWGCKELDTTEHTQDHPWNTPWILKYAMELVKSWGKERGRRETDREGIMTL